MRAVVIGAVESSRIAIEAIAQDPQWTLPLVISLPAALGHRHSDFVDLSAQANLAGADFLGIANINSHEALAAIRAAEPDFVFVIGWSQICGPEFREAARQQVIGYHPAPLPRLRGRGVIPWTILAGEPISGGTLFWIDDGVDSGPILAQRFFHVAPDVTADILYQQHMTALGAMMAEALVALGSGAAPKIVQDEKFATWAAKRTPADGVIDWHRPAREIERLIRAVGAPYPGATTVSKATQLTIWSAEISACGAVHLGMPGQVIARDSDSFTVMCGDNMALRVTAWNDGCTPMPAMHSRLTSDQHLVETAQPKPLPVELKAIRGHA